MSDPNMSAEHDRQHDDPSQEQIEKRAAQIRKRWSDRVKKKRHLRAPTPWAVPNVQLNDIADADSI